MQVECPCGKTFERQPQRGRPAVWCPACRNLPMSQRAARETETDEEGSPVVSRHGEHDPLSHVEREEIEAGMLEIGRRYREEIVPNKAKLWPDMNEVDRSGACLEWHRAETVKLYEKTCPLWWQAGRTKRS